MSNLDVLFSSESVEWYTPAKYLTAARRVLGRIELDPASCERANGVVQAERFFTIETDGLSQEWNADAVFLNPPYGTKDGISNQRLWSEKLIAEFSAGRTKQAILLVNASTSEKWFKPLWSRALCFTDYRIKFIPPPECGKKNQPTKGSAFVYFGDDPALFFREFAGVGECVITAGLFRSLALDVLLNCFGGCDISKGVT